MDLGAALGEHIAQIGGFGLQMDGHRHPQTGKGLLLLEAGLNAAQGGHEVPNPVDFAASGGGKRGIFHNTHIRNLLGGPPKGWARPRNQG